MPGTSSSSEPGIAWEVARPPETCTILSSRPWMTSVGHAQLAQPPGAVGLGQDRDHLPGDARPALTPRSHVSRGPGERPPPRVSG